MASMQKRLFEEAKSAGVLTMESPLSRFLSMCAETGRHEMFYDQLPRWLLFGAPSRLCRELARLPVCMERRIKNDQQDGRAKRAVGANKLDVRCGSGRAEQLLVQKTSGLLCESASGDQ